MSEIRKRCAARLVVLDSYGRVLLFRYAWKPGESFWATPGGGLEDGETFDDAAQREAAEELGIAGGALKFLWERSTEFTFKEQLILQQEKFFLLQGELSSLLHDVERAHNEEGIREVRWWTVRELETTEETVFPENLAEELCRTVTGQRVLASR
jgi:ADP-ribose pyrophosphatase YjhB (NUDIX family)